MWHSNSAYEAIDAAHAFHHFGIDLPDDATHWVQRLNELRGTRPVQPPPNAVAVLLADNAKAADIDEAIAAHLGHNHRRNQHSEAETIAGARALNSILKHRDELHDQLASIANDLITRLHQAAQITEDIRELTRQRRTDEAHLLATADSDASELNDAYTLRDNYLTAPGSHWSTGWFNCQHWSNPWDITGANATGANANHDGSLWGVWAANVPAGGKLWFPSYEEARAASQTHEPNELAPPFNPVQHSTATFV